jgi:hypothetical protein
MDGGWMGGALVCNDLLSPKMLGLCFVDWPKSLGKM